MSLTVRTRTEYGVTTFFVPFALLGVWVILLAPSAEGAIIQDPPPDEASLAEIFSHALGGDFVAVGDDFSNGTIEAIRLSDDDDQLFSAPGFTAELVASFAGFTQEFGVIPEGGVYQPLIPQTGDEFDVSGSANVSFDNGFAFAFARSGDEGVAPASSVPADNSDNTDHMAAYLIQQADGGATEDGLTRLFLFFEDLPAEGSDFDYNDMVVDVTLVPEPASLALVALGLMCMAHFGRPRWVSRTS